MPESEFTCPEWEWPEPLPELPPETGSPPSLLPPEIEDGDYLILRWRGGMTTEGVPSVDPRYSVVWEKAKTPAIEFSLIFYQWELWGTERTPGLTTGTDQSSVPLNTAPAGAAVSLGADLKRLRLPPAGEVTLGFLEKGVAQIQAGYWPRINVTVNSNSRRPYSALLSHREGEWIWTLQ